MSVLRLTESEKETLRNAFPYSLRQQVNNAIQIIPSERSLCQSNGQMSLLNYLIFPNGRTASLDGEFLKIPYRLYFDEPEAYKERMLAPIERTILNCIYLKHHSGYVRQRRLTQLMDSTDYFVIAHTIQLLGEYVIYILEVLDQHINDSTIDKYAKFIDENKDYWQLTKSRITSYWNEYFRRGPLDNYLGKKIFDRINGHALRSA